MKEINRAPMIFAVLAVPLIFSVLSAIAWSMRWPLVGDASLMHYIVFLMSKGMTPYKDIVDVNLPGAYFFEAFAMRLFGWGALAWRLYDLALLLIVALAMSSIAGSKRKFAGLLAASMFLLIHIQDGIAQLGQRDLLVAALLLSGYALLFSAQEHPRGGLTIFLWSFFIGLSITVKPLFLPLGIVLLLVSAKRSHSLRVSPARHFACGATGLSLPSVCAVLWLWHRGALRAFQAIATTLIPFHASLGRKSISYLLAHSMSPVAIVCAAWVIVVIALRPELLLKRLEIMIGVVAALLAYIGQGKGYPYHRYPLLCMLLILMECDFVEGWNRQGIVKTVSFAMIALQCLVLAPRTAWLCRSFDPATPFQQALSKELMQFGPQTSGQVQCLDTFGGCVGTLYNLRLMQNTGYLYDCYLFNPDRNAVYAGYRRAFWQAYQAGRPHVIVLTDQFCFGDTGGFHKLDAWPQLRDDLIANYAEVKEWHSTTKEHWWSRSVPPAQFRIYTRRP